MKVRESVVAQFEYHRQRRLQTITQVAGANSKPGTRNLKRFLLFRVDRQTSLFPSVETT